MIIRFSTAAATLLLLTACSSGDGSEPTNTKGATKPAPAPSGATETPGDPASPTTPTDPTTPTRPLPTTDPKSSACALPELKGTDVSPAFLVYDPPATQPAAAQGGKIDGKYVIDKATVYLPTSTKGLVKPAQSTGTVNGWAIFNGKDYRIALHADLQVQSIIGAQPQKADVVDQGTFSTTGSAIKLETSCTGQPAPAAEVTFTESGARGILIIKQTTTRGDTYLVVEAARTAD